MPIVDASRANAELRDVRGRSALATAAATERRVVDNGVPGVLAYLCVIWLLPSLEADATFGWHWLSIGANGRRSGDGR